jgi:4-methyl-5(b-hydroxyethyl)-thiazole monophosphate biosynthesis
MSPVHVAVLLAPGCETIEALTPIDVLRRAGAAVTTYAVAPAVSITTAQGIALTAEKTIDELEVSSLDALVVPGGQPGVDNIMANAAAMDAIAQMLAHGKLTAAICAAPMALAKLGAAHDHVMTVYPGCEAGFPGWEPPATWGVYQDGNVLTASGPGFALPFALAVCEALLGEDVRHQVAAGMLVEQD